MFLYRYVAPQDKIQNILNTIKLSKFKTKMDAIKTDDVDAINM